MVANALCNACRMQATRRRTDAAWSGWGGRWWPDHGVGKDFLLQHLPVPFIPGARWGRSVCDGSAMAFADRRLRDVASQLARTVFPM